MGSSLAILATGWGLVMSLSPLLQVRVVLQRRSSKEVSIGWIVVLLIGFVLWGAYGLSIRNLPLVLTNIVSCTVCAFTLTVVLRFRSR
jgi:MtN3 and saliva related transmembrane protein